MHLYNKRPELKIKDSQGNEISAQNVVTMSHLKKNPDGTLGFVNIPPQVYEFSKSKYPAAFNETVVMYGANFSTDTTLSIEGCTVTNLTYLSPYKMIFEITVLTETVPNCEVITNNGVESRQRNLMSIIDGVLIPFDGSGMVETQGPLIYDETGKIRKPSSYSGHAGFNYPSVQFNPNENFEIYFKIEPAYFEHGNLGLAVFGVRESTDTEIYMSNTKGPVMQKGGTPANQGTASFEWVWSVKRFGENLAFYGNGVKIADLDAAAASKTYNLAGRLANTANYYDIQIFSLDF